jgi:glutamine cyclotransferase
MHVVDSDGYAQSSLNELQFIDGYIWANIYMSNKIVKIDPSTGNVVRYWNMTDLERDAN